MELMLHCWLQFEVFLPPRHPIATTFSAQKSGQKSEKNVPFWEWEAIEVKACQNSCTNYTFLQVILTHCAKCIYSV